MSIVYIVLRYCMKYVLYVIMITMFDYNLGQYWDIFVPLTHPKTATVNHYTDIKSAERCN